MEAETTDGDNGKAERDSVEHTNCLEVNNEVNGKVPVGAATGEAAADATVPHDDGGGEGSKPHCGLPEERSDSDHSNQYLLNIGVSRKQPRLMSHANSVT
jgi:hypothetical protein